MEPIVLILSSAIILLLTYFKISITNYQQIILFLLLISFLGYTHFQKKERHFPASLEIWTALFIGSLFTQLLVISTGGMFSPFFILIHLCALTISFLVNTKSSTSFIALAAFTLTINAWFNPASLQLIKNDPGTLLLYLASLVVIIPLSQLISGKYHFKEEVSKILTKQVAVGDAVLERISELVLVTDKNLTIILANDALEKNLKLNRDEVLGKSLLDVLSLKDEAGQDASLTSLSIDKALTDKNTYIINNFSLFTKNRTAPIKVTIQIRPIADTLGNIDQLSFVITEGNVGVMHTDLEKAQAALDMRLANLRQQLHLAKFNKLETELELIIKTEKDVLVAQELEDHPVKEFPKLTDVAAISQILVQAKNSLAQSLNVNLKFSLKPEDAAESSLLNLQKSNFASRNLSPSNFSVALDDKWVIICIDKILDIALLLSSGTQIPWVQVTPSRLEKSIDINILASSPPILSEEKPLLFTQYFGSLGQKTNLRFGSGLEGFIAKTISTELNIPIQVEFFKNPSQISFTISIPRKSNL